MTCRSESHVFKLLPVLNYAVQNLLTMSLSGCLIRKLVSGNCLQRKSIPKNPAVPQSVHNFMKLLTLSKPAAVEANLGRLKPLFYREFYMCFFTRGFYCKVSLIFYVLLH